MTNIELPTYKTIVPNEVFGKKAKALKSPMGEVPATQVARLTRFKIPVFDEVIDFIITSAKGIGNYSSGRDEKPSDDDSKLIHFLKLIPPSEVKDIAMRDKDSLEHLKRHYPQSVLQIGRDYLQVSNGTLPNEALDSARKLLEKEGSVVYERAIERIGAKEWNLIMRLQDDGALPDSLELEYLLDRGVRESDVFSTRGDFESYNDVASQIRILYKALYSPKMIAQVGESSYQFLEQLAASTIEGVARCITAKKVIGESLTSLFGAFIKPEGKKQKGPFGYSGGDCSLN